VKMIFWILFQALTVQENCICVKPSDPIVTQFDLIFSLYPKKQETINTDSSSVLFIYSRIVFILTIILTNI